MGSSKGSVDVQKSSKNPGIAIRGVSDPCQYLLADLTQCTEGLSEIFDFKIKTRPLGFGEKKINF